MQYQRKVLPFGPAKSLGIFLHLLKPFCSFANARVSVLLYIWIISWSWLALSVQVRGYDLFVFSFGFLQATHLFFQVWTWYHSSLLLSRNIIQWTCLCPCYLINSLRYSSWLIPYCITTCYSLSGHLFFGQGQFLFQETCTNLTIALCQSESHTEYLSFSSSLLLFFSFLPFCSTSTAEIVSLQQSPVPLWCPHSDVVLTMDVTLNHWDFYFQGIRLLLSSGGAWSASMCNVHIT